MDDLGAGGTGAVKGLRGSGTGGLFVAVVVVENGFQ